MIWTEYKSGTAEPFYHHLNLSTKIMHFLSNFHFLSKYIYSNTQNMMRELT